MGAEQEARPRPRALSAVKAAASHLEDVGRRRRVCVRNKKEKETSQSQERFCFCISESAELAADLCGKTQKEERTQTCSESNSNSNALGERESAIRGKHCFSRGVILKGFSVRAATIPSITGSGGEHCSAGVQFAVSTRHARFITN